MRTPAQPVSRDDELKPITSAALGMTTCPRLNARMGPTAGAVSCLYQATDARRWRTRAHDLPIPVRATHETGSRHIRAILVKSMACCDIDDIV